MPGPIAVAAGTDCAAPQAEASPSAANPSPKPVAVSGPVVGPGAPGRRVSQAKAARLDDLPEYARSLLRIEVPVVVTLAEKRQPLGWILELGPGSIIQFDKSCEEMLELAAGGRRIAMGEAVKVGDKFGLRITSIILPDERFRPVSAPTRNA